MAFAGEHANLQPEKPLRLRCRTRAGTLAGAATAILLTTLAFFITMFSWHLVLGQYFGVTTGVLMYLVVAAGAVSLATFGIDWRQTSFDSAARTATVRHRCCGVPVGPARVLAFSDIEAVTVKTTDVGSFLLLKCTHAPGPQPVAEGPQSDMLAFASRIRRLLAGEAGV